MAVKASTCSGRKAQHGQANAPPRSAARRESGGALRRESGASALCGAWARGCAAGWRMASAEYRERLTTIRGGWREATD
eukprot:scaffold263904_cov35-Tisochrysis_lutea.AAC.4